MASAQSQPQVLVIRGGAIGDFILTLPAIGLLRESLPNAKIEILGYRPVIELATLGGYADSLRDLEHGSMAKLFVPGAVLDDTLMAYFRRFNLVLSYLYDPDGYFQSNMARIGVKTFLAASHRIQAGQGHATEQLAKPLEALAMYLDNPAPRLRLTPAASVETGTVALHIGSGSMTKNWPLEHWIRLVQKIRQEQPRIPIAIITGEAEAERGMTTVFREFTGGLNLLHWDQLPLTELAARLAGCRAFLGHDSGVSHLAAAVGLPALLLFGPTDPALWAPRNSGVKVLRAPGVDLAGLEYEGVRDALKELLVYPL